MSGDISLTFNGRCQKNLEYASSFLRGGEGGGGLFNDIRREGDLMCILGANIYASTTHHHANPSVKSNNLVLILVGFLCPRLTAMFDVRPGCLSGDV